jgi:hypothetical protein
MSGIQFFSTIPAPPQKPAPETAKPPAEEAAEAPEKPPAASFEAHLATAAAAGVPQNTPSSDRSDTADGAESAFPFPETPAPDGKKHPGPGNREATGTLPVYPDALDAGEAGPGRTGHEKEQMNAVPLSPPGDLPGGTAAQTPARPDRLPAARIPADAPPVYDAARAVQEAVSPPGPTEQASVPHPPAAGHASRPDNATPPGPEKQAVESLPAAYAEPASEDHPPSYSPDHHAPHPESHSYSAPEHHKAAQSFDLPTVSAGAPPGTIRAPASGPAGQTAPFYSPSHPAPLTDQIVPHLQFSIQQGQRETVFQLRPEHLGWMHLRVIVEDQGVTTHIRVEEEATRRMIEASMPHLRQALADQGLRVDRIEVETGPPMFDASSQRQPQPDRRRTFSGRMPDVPMEEEPVQTRLTPGHRVDLII